MEENNRSELDLETKAELFERKAAGYRQNWMNAEGDAEHAVPSFTVLYLHRCLIRVGFLPGYSSPRGELP